MFTDKNTRVKKLEVDVLNRKKIVTTLKEWYYTLFFLVPVLAVLYLFFSNVNTVIYWYLVGAFVLIVLCIVKCYFLIKKFEDERRVLRTELSKIQENSVKNLHKKST